LALMNHVNVAKVFDAGATEQLRPYFSMELVASFVLAIGLGFFVLRSR
jgi:hypothetical protein